MMDRLSTLGLAVACGLAATAYGQNAPGMETRTGLRSAPGAAGAAKTPLADSGPVANTQAGSGPRVVWSTTVMASRAPWIRVALRDVQLSGDAATERASYILITSLADGAQQRLTAPRLREWNGASAYFNGDAVRIDLVAWPATGTSRIVVDRAIPGTPPPAGGPGDSLCGPDDRVLSTDARVARVLPSGGGVCTAFLISDNAKCMLSAGHCAPGQGAIVEFNVPLSTTGGALVHPPPESQFAIDAGSVQSVSQGPGNDWAYFGVFANPNTGLGAASWQGGALTTGPAPAGSGQTLLLAGYGSVSSPVSPTWNQAQKRGTGPFSALAGSAMQHQIDATAGDDGAPVRLAATGLTIGIHDGDGCTSSANTATAVQNPGLQAALAAPTGVCSRPLSPPEPPLYVAGDASGSLMTISRSSASVGFVGSTGIPGEVRALAYDRGRQRFYAAENVPDGPDRLYAVDRATGAATLIGSMSGPLDINGLAYDPNTDTLFGMDRGTGQLYRIDLSTAAATPVGAPSHAGIAEIDMDPSRSVLYGIDNSQSARLVTIDLATGAVAVVGALGSGVTRAEGLAYCLDDAFLYSTNGTNGALLRINPETGAASIAGPTGVVQASGVGMACAYDCAPPCMPNTPIPPEGGQQLPITQNTAWLGCSNQKCLALDVNPGLGVNNLLDVLTATGGSTVIGPLTPGSSQLTGMTWNGAAMYGIDLATGNLVRLDTTTGAPTLVGPTGITGWQALASDQNDNGQLYGITQNNSLYRINFFNGATTLVAANVGSLVTAMAMDRTSQLWGIEFVSGRVLRINKDTGATTVATTTIAGFQGMDFDDTGLCYAINSSGADKLYTVNLATGIATLRGQTNSNTATDMAFGMALFMSPPPPPPPAPGIADAALPRVYDPTNLTLTTPITIDTSKLIDADHHGLPPGMAAVQGVLYPAASAPILPPPPPGGSGLEDAVCGGTLINFDDIPAPCSFDLATRLTYTYASRGVVFEGPGGNDGGAMLNQCSGFGTTGGTGPNALVFNPGAGLADGGLARGAETLRFTSPVSSVQALVGSATGGVATMQAYRGATLVASRSQPLSATMQPLGVIGSGITRVVISFSGSLVLDDLCFVQSCPTTYDIYFGTSNPPATRVVTSSPNTFYDPGSLESTTLYYWRIVAKNCCGQTAGPVWQFSTVCYVNCDLSTIPPVLNVNDFICFLNRFARGEFWANCDDSTIPPILNVNDFVCFINKYAAGCP